MLQKPTETGRVPCLWFSWGGRHAEVKPVLFATQGARVEHGAAPSSSPVSVSALHSTLREIHSCSRRSEGLGELLIWHQIIRELESASPAAISHWDWPGSLTEWGLAVLRYPAVPCNRDRVQCWPPSSPSCVSQVCPSWNCLDLLGKSLLSGLATTGQRDVQGFRK